MPHASAQDKLCPIPAHDVTMQAIQRALEASGIEFTDGDEPGLKLRKR